MAGTEDIKTEGLRGTWFLPFCYLQANEEDKHESCNTNKTQNPSDKNNYVM